MKNEPSLQIPNYGKLAMLHRLAGSPPLVVYSGTARDSRKLYDVFRQWCNDSADIELLDTEIRCKNPMLAWHLQKVVKTQRIVPPGDASFRTDSGGGMILSACDDPSHRQGREGETEVRNRNDNDGRVVKKKTNGGIFMLITIAITCALIFLTGYIAGGGCQHKGHVRSQSTSRVSHDSEEYDDRWERRARWGD